MHPFRLAILTFLFLISGSEFEIASAQTAGFENREWTIEEYFDGHALAPASDLLWVGNPLTITFSNGALDGQAPCGEMVGGYSWKQDHLSIEAGYLLLGSCIPVPPQTSHSRFDLPTTNNLLFTALNGERQIRQEGARIDLIDLNGQIQIVLAPTTAPQ